MQPSSQVIHNAIKRHAGLSDFDDEAIADEVFAIRKALRRAGYSIINENCDMEWTDLYDNPECPNYAYASDDEEPVASTEATNERDGEERA